LPLPTAFNDDNHTYRRRSGIGRRTGTPTGQPVSLADSWELRYGSEEAIALAEAEDYAETLDYGYLGLAQAYQLADEIGHGAEVYLLVRDSHLAAEE
jgi:hypothetical protein